MKCFIKKIARTFTLAIAKINDDPITQVAPCGFGQWLLRFDNILNLCYDMFAYLALLKQECRDNFVDMFNKKRDNTLFFNKSKYSDMYMSSLKSQNKSLLMHIHGSLLHYRYEDIVYKYYKPDAGSLSSLLSFDKNTTCVVGGTGNYKLRTISKNPYLKACWEYYDKIIGNDEKKDIFIFGASLQEKDAHIVNVLKNANNANVYLACRTDSSMDISDNHKMVYHSINDREKSRCFFVKIPENGLPFEQETSRNPVNR